MGGDNKKNKNKRKRKKYDDSDEEWNASNTNKKKKRMKNDDDDDAFHSTVNVAEKNEDADNPMPEFVDIMTGIGVIKPAISPYGHVLGYDTWCKILRTSKHKNLCPFTLQKMTRRSLVKLTKTNGFIGTVECLKECFDSHKKPITYFFFCLLTILMTFLFNILFFFVVVYIHYMK